MDVPDLVRRIHSSFASCVGSIPLEKLHHPCCDALLTEKTTAGSSKNVLRHIEQQSSILGHMEKNNLLSPTAAYVELGAGRGMLSLAMAQAFPDALYMLIDRGSNRGKADHFMREGVLSAVSSGATSSSEQSHPAQNVYRAKIDIRHLNLAGMRELNGASIVGMSKHLCGVATDLSLRALVQTLPRQDNNSVSSQFKGLAIALCCHHVCRWEDYVNPTFFLAQGFEADEFALITSLTSWATCSIQDEGDTVERLLGLQ